MSQPRKHHYLPQFYLGRFSADGHRLWQIEKSPAARSYLVSLEDAGAIRDYHTLDAKEISDPYALERQMAVVEGAQATALSRVLAADRVEPEVRAAIVEFVSVMRLRVPSVKAQIEDSLRQVVRATTELMKRGGQLPELVKIERRYGDHAVDIEIANWKVLEQMFALAGDPQILSILNGMCLTIVRARGQTEFVTGDQPVAYYNPLAGQASPYGIPLTHPDTVLTLSLSGHRALRLSWRDDAPEVEDLGDEEVGELNRRTAIMAQFFLFSPRKSEAAEALARAHASHLAGFQFETLDAGTSFVHIGRLRAIGPDR